MGMEIENDVVMFDAVIYEDTVVPLRNLLQERAPDHLIFDLTACDDMHLAVVQEIVAYRRLYECDYRFGTEKKTYQKVIEGFDVSEDNCSQ